MDIIDIINLKLAEMGKTGAEMSRELGFSNSIYSQWNTRKTRPSNKTLAKLAKYFNVSVESLLSAEALSNVSLQPDASDETVHKTLSQIKENAEVLGVDPYSIMSFDTASRALENDLNPTPLNPNLSSTEFDHIIKYRSLDPYGQKAVNDLLETEYQRTMEAQQTDLQEDVGEIVYFSIPEYAHPMSAGTGEMAGQDYPDNLRLVKEPPRGSSYVARVKGNSMEPTYHNGDRVFISAYSDVRVGQVGVFLMDGQQWIKELGDGELISHNPTYGPIPMTEDIICQGRVLGVCDESYTG